MAAYHSIAVTLGQAGMVRELMSIIERMKEKPSKYIKNARSKSWNPTLQPDIVVYNSVRGSLLTFHLKALACFVCILKKTVICRY